MTKIDIKGVNVPNLRFPGFDGEWEVKKLGEVAPLQRGFDLPVEKIKKGKHPVVFSNGILKFHNEFKSKAPGVVTGRSGTIGKVTFVENDYWPHNTALWVTDFKGNVPKFIYFFYSKYKLERLGTGSGVPTLNRNDVHIQNEYFPKPDEQQKIASFLSLIDERIQTQNKIIGELKLLKSTLRYQLFKQITNNEYETLSIKEILEYEQPTKYLVSSTDYSLDTLLIPVLTANKSFILGYTDEKFGIYDKGDCIIFDDFTMDMKYVDFNFKVKSSAIKILKPKSGINLRFVFEYLSFLNLESGEHKRHYISEIEPTNISLPSLDIQDKTAEILLNIESKMNIELKIHRLLTNQKKYLLSNLFI